MCIQHYYMDRSLDNEQASRKLWKSEYLTTNKKKNRIKYRDPREALSKKRSKRIDN